MEELLKRIATILEVLNKERYTNSFQLKELKMKTVGYGQRAVMQEDPADWESFQEGSHWGGKDTHCCFKANVTIPREYEGKEAVVTLQTGATDIWNTDNPQFIAYIDKEMICALDINHQEVRLTEKAEPGRTYELGFYAYSNTDEPSIVIKVTVSVLHREVERLYYDLKVPYEAASLQHSDSLDRIHTIQRLSEAVNLLDLRKTGSESFYQSVVRAEEYLQKNFYEKLCREQEVTVHSIGHTHIDVAWKWPLRQTREKVLRSFQTVLYLMKQYPEYRFMSSQPQLYEYVKEDCPEVYEQIRERVQEGRWETEGAMWLEADCNLTSGESLIRQILYGKQFFKDEFGTCDNQVLWLPDVFGYSAALPQIMRKSGLKYFMTTKIAWNEKNQIPNDVMIWKGIDGSEVLTYFITTRNYTPYYELSKTPDISTTYNGRQNASQIMGTWQRFQNKDLLQEVLTCYGHGDGGGGTTASMIEESRRMEKGIPGCPQTRQTFSREFFELIERKLEGKKIPRWNGELYLEFHRGTYTSMARNKRYNRLCEFLNADVELFGIIDMVTGGKDSYPVDQLKKAWKLTLLNQFHDILPGSSINEVYEDSRRQYEEILQLDQQCISQAFESISASVPVRATDDKAVLMVWNQLGFERDAIIELSSEELAANHLDTEIEILECGKLIPVQKTAQGNVICQIGQLPAKGYRTLQIAAKGICDNHCDKDTIAELASEKETDRVIDRVTDIITDRATDNTLENTLWNEASDSNKVVNRTIETPYYLVEFNQTGEIVSLYDKEADRELIQKGCTANQLLVFEDRPNEYDAWNIDSTYTEKCWQVSDVQSFSVTERGPVRTCIHIERSFMDSLLEQDIIFYPDSRRIDFKTVVDWRESQLLLKTAFPLDITTEKATYEIQYGNVERPTHRNTSWEQAKFEVCAHKWADLSENGYGAALLNDCKYGYDVQESVLRLTLIKSGIFPNPTADQEVHHFTYSLFPHLGDFREGKVVQEAYKLNCPAYERILTSSDKPAADQSWSLLTVDQENVMVDVVKKAEENDDIIIRMYEAYGRRSKVEVTFTGLPKAYQMIECDLMERDLVNDHNFQSKSDNDSSEENKLRFILKPYEIKTYRLCKK